MKFPDVGSMAEFILVNKVSKIETNTSAKTISGFVSEEHIAIAETKFGAELICLKAF